ncbi:MAG: lysylphosphatidylglycerol synthase domain-containing protein [Acidithiobacillus sp.]
MKVAEGERPKGRMLPTGPMLIYASGLLGLLLALALVLHEGARSILQILAHSGWALLWLLPFHFLPLGLDVLSWKWLLRGESRAGFCFLLWVAAVRESVNGLLPVARVGGEVVGARLLTRHGVSGYLGGASIMVEVTLTLVSQFLFTLLGLVVLVYAISDHAMELAVLLALAFMAPVVLGFLWVQHRWGFFQILQRLMKMLLGGKDLLLRLGDPAVLDAEIRALYGQRWALLTPVFWQCMGLLAGALEVWFTFWILGHPVPWWAAILMESLGQALRSAAFLVPGGIGIQEGGFVLFGAAAGIGPDLALAFSLARRFRELVLGGPVLLSWQALEGHHLHRKWRRAQTPKGEAS